MPGDLPQIFVYREISIARLMICCVMLHIEMFRRVHVLYHPDTADFLKFMIVVHFNNGSMKNVKSF